MCQKTKTAFYSSPRCYLNEYPVSESVLLCSSFSNVLKHRSSFIKPHSMPLNLVPLDSPPCGAYFEQKTIPRHSNLRLWNLFVKF
jgi:hypothetical protein